MELNQKHCLPCQVGGSSLKDEEEEKFMDKMVGWNLVREGIHKIKKEFKFKNFKEGICLAL